MFTTLTPWLLAAVVSSGVQLPPLLNARVETHATPIEQAIAAAGAGLDPVWVAWRSPMVPGDRDLCSTWSNGDAFARGAWLEGRLPDAAEATSALPAGPVPLEAGASLLVLVRVVSGAVERIRVVTDDCPIDAGGRRLLWLSSVDAAASVRFLDTLVSPSAFEIDTTRRRASSALTAIALHDDASADAVLDRLLSPAGDPTLRSQAATWTARARGARGFDRIVGLVESGADARLRRALVAALGDTRQPGTLARLLTIAGTDDDEHVRGEALFAYARLAPDADLASVRTILSTDTSDEVRRRGVRGVARRRSGTTSLLVDLARSSSDRIVRTEAVRALGQSPDQAARDYLTELLKD